MRLTGSECNGAGIAANHPCAAAADRKAARPTKPLSILFVTALIALSGTALLPASASATIANGNAADCARADMSKTLRTEFPVADSGFDMPRAQNTRYSNAIGMLIFEPLLRYDFFSDTPAIIPNTIEAMPTISADGLTYTFHVKKGILFADDPAFNGQPRELTARDYAYTLMRLSDPAFHAPRATEFLDLIKGYSEGRALAEKVGTLDYDQLYDGIQVLDSHTLQLTLTRPDPDFLSLLTHADTGAVAREVVALYGDAIAYHPVGSGPYQLESYLPQSKIVLAANPRYRGLKWDAPDAFRQKYPELVRQMQGKTLPRIGRIDVSIITEPQTAWLTFNSYKLDLMLMPPLISHNALDQHNRLRTQQIKKGTRLHRHAGSVVSLTVFNMRDPVIGGYSEEKIALRRAISLAYDLPREIQIVYHGQGIKAESLIVPGKTAYDPSYRSNIGYHPRLAARLLDHFGYRRGEDGYRSLPNGEPLVLTMLSSPDKKWAILNEIMKKSMDRIGIRIQFTNSNFSDNIKSMLACKGMLWGLAYGTEKPNSAEMFGGWTSRAVHSDNTACYESAAYDALYAAAAQLPDGPDKKELKKELIYAMVRRLEADTPLLPLVYRVDNVLARKTVEGYHWNPYINPGWQYLDLNETVSD